MLPLIDFLNSAAEYRRRHSGRKQLIAKAFGIKFNQTLRVVDATAGLGQDAAVLAYLGCEVTMIERSPIIGSLLQDALKHAQANIEFAKLKLKLIIADAIAYLKNLSADRPDVIYLDPMYPAHTKSALNKKAMRILKNIVGEDLDAPELLQAALTAAKKRVVAKRRRLAPIIPGPKPDITYKGQSCRFDVYFKL